MGWPSAILTSVLQTSCPVVIGRDDEIAEVAQRLDDSRRRGTGGVVVVCGPGGIGKSRLADEMRTLAASSGMRVAVGRSVPSGAATPFRALSEALLAAFRSDGMPADPQLDAFRGHLGQLVPDWAGAPTAESSTLLVGEAIVRLLRAGDDGSGWLVVLEDLQWADADTLEVAEFLADTLTGEAVLCLVTVRTDGTTPTGADVVSRLRSRRARVLELAPLDDHGVAEMTQAYLGLDAPLAGLDEFIATQSEGSPLYVEELLAGLISTGSLSDAGDGWVVGNELQVRAPASLIDSVRSRLDALGSGGRTVLSAAAVVGRRFDWQLLAEIASVDEPVVSDVLREAVAVQLVAVDNDEFVFRHALIHQAVLDDLLPPETVRLAGRAVAAIERAHSDLPGAWCELAAALAETAGDGERAGRHLITSSRRSARRGAFSTAANALEHARRITSGPTRRLVEHELVSVWSRVGRASAAIELGTQLLATDADLAPADRLELLNSVALAALAVGDMAAAASASDEAMAVAAADGTDTGRRGRAEALAARVAVELGDTVQADRLAISALTHAAEAGRADVECDALEVRGRATDHFGDRIAWFERCRDVAERAGLTARRLHAEFSASTIAAMLGDSARLRRTRDLAASFGAADTAAVADLVIADFALLTLDHDTCLDAAQRCAEASRRFGLATLPVALLWLAGAHAIAGRSDEMEAILAEATEISDGDPRIVADEFGRVRATRAFLTGDRDAFRTALDRSVVMADRAPSTSSVFAGRLNWLLLESSDADDLGAAARQATADLVNAPVFGSVYGWSEAIADGRRGDPEAATATFQRHASTLPAATAAWGAVQVARLLVAETALRDGWGEPVPWIRALEAWFFERGLERVARDCRSLLGQAGEPVPRRRRGQAPVPPQLRALGITGRELEVLLLVAQHRSNRDIAEQLFLSVRTVEHHIASLFTRTGVRERGQLAEFAALT